MKRNVADRERVASVLLAGLSIGQALKKERSNTQKVLAASASVALLWRGLTANCPVYSKLDVSTRDDRETSILPTMLDRSALINASPAKVRKYLESKATFYGDFESGSNDDEFSIKLGSRKWILQLSEHADGKRTLIKMSWSELSPDKISLDSSSDSKTPSMLELRKLKSIIETGELATIEGQSHGERSGLGTLIEKFGDSLLHKIQSKTPLPIEELSNKNKIPSEKSSPIMKRAQA